MGQKKYLPIGELFFEEPQESTPMTSVKARNNIIENKEFCLFVEESGICKEQDNAKAVEVRFAEIFARWLRLFSMESVLEFNTFVANHGKANLIYILLGMELLVKRPDILANSVENGLERTVLDFDKGIENG